MALKGTLNLNTKPFEDALNDAVAKSKKLADQFGQTMPSSIRATETALKRLRESFSGDAIYKQARTVEEAIKSIGGVTKLTQKELKSAQSTIDELVEKYGKLKIAVPVSISQLQQELHKLANASGDAEAKTGGFFKSLAGSVAIGTLVASALTSAARSAVQMARDFFRSADALVSLSDKTGLSIEYLQKLECHF